MNPTLWKITVRDEQDAITLGLEGRFVGPSTAELEQVWRSLAPNLGSKKLRVDLRGITQMNRYGLKQLAEINKSTRAIFLADSPLTNYLAEQARGQASPEEWLCPEMSEHQQGEFMEQEMKPRTCFDDDRG